MRSAQVQQVLAEQPVGRPRHLASSAALERLLAALEHERLTPLDVRIMVQVSDGEATVEGIAEMLRQSRSTIRSAIRRLVARGLLRRHRRPGRPLTIALGPTKWGIGALRRISASLPGGAPAVEGPDCAAAGRAIVVGYDGSGAAEE